MKMLRDYALRLTARLWVKKNPVTKIRPKLLEMAVIVDGESIGSIMFDVNDIPTAETLDKYARSIYENHTNNTRKHLH